MNPKYFNDAIIGNKNIRATFSSKGELLRAYYPNVDFKQFVDFFHVGVKINDSLSKEELTLALTTSKLPLTEYLTLTPSIKSLAFNLI